MTASLDFVPRSDIDLYSDESLFNPYPLYRSLRDMAPVVYFPHYDAYILSRFDDVRAALRNPKVFSSASGVMLNEPMNQAVRGVTLCTDDPQHAALRKVVQKPLTPAAVQAYKELVFREADQLIDRLVAKKRIDAATDLAQYLPITIVSELVGLPEKGREHMLEWSSASFDCIGPMNARAQQGMATVGEMVQYALTQCTRDQLKPGSWAHQIWDAAERGEITPNNIPTMMIDYMGPALDTTILATSSLIWLLSQHPEQWEALRQDPSLIPGAINEAIRIESPVQNFSRRTLEDISYGDALIPANSRVIVSFASANRDERKWGNPDVFDIRRSNADHVGFGFGVHVCVGLHMAKLEIAALLQAMIPRVKRIEYHGHKVRINNVLHGLDALDVSLHA